MSFKFTLSLLGTLALSGAPLVAQETSASETVAGPVPKPMPRPTLKAYPTFLTGDHAEFPAEAKALGHHGTTTVAFEIDAMGSVISTTLRQGSGSDLLDAAALATAKTARFTPALDAEGNAIPFKFVTPYHFYQSQSDVPGGGLIFYSCSAFTTEMDWWDAQHPDKDGKDHDKVYSLLLGLRVAAHPGGMMAGLADISVTSAHKSEWAIARAQCRAHPDRLLIDYLQYKDAIIRMSKWEAERAKRP